MFFELMELENIFGPEGLKILIFMIIMCRDVKFESVKFYKV